MTTKHKFIIYVEAESSETKLPVEDINADVTILLSDSYFDSAKVTIFTDSAQSD